MPKNKFVLSCLLICYFTVGVYCFKGCRQQYNITNEAYVSTNINATDSIFSWVNLVDTLDKNLPYKIYKKQADSLQQIEDLHKGKNSNNFISSFKINDWFGVAQYRAEKKDNTPNFIKQLDSLNILARKDSNIKWVEKKLLDSVYNTQTVEHSWFGLSKLHGSDSSETYLTLENYVLDDKSKLFFAKNNKNYIGIPHYNFKGKQYADVYYTSKPIFIKYDNLEDKHSGTIYIPISTTKAKWYITVGNSIFVLLFLCTICIVIFFPIIIIVNISKGNPFAAINRKLLNLSALAIAIVCFLNVLVPFYISWLYSKQIPSDFVRLYSSEYMLWPCLASALLYTLGLALKKGASLQQETDLTI